MSRYAINYGFLDDDDQHHHHMAIPSSFHYPATPRRNVNIFANGYFNVIPMKIKENFDNIISKQTNKSIVD